MELIYVNCDIPLSPLVNNYIGKDNNTTTQNVMMVYVSLKKLHVISLALLWYWLGFEYQRPILFHIWYTSW